MKKNLLFMLGLAMCGLCACSGESGMDIVTGAASNATRSGEGDAPAVVTDSVVYSDGSAAWVYATLTSNGSSAIKNRGVVFSYDVNDPKLGVDGCRSRRTSVDTLNTFSVNMIALSIGKTYYVRAYAINSSDTAYGNVLSFTTKEKEYTYPTIKTLPVRNVVKYAAIAYGQLLTKGDATIKSYGLCLSTSPCPTVKDNYIACPNMASDTGFEGQFGAFFDNLTPNTLYHIRACIVANDSTIYGQDRIFRTANGGFVTWEWVNWINGDEKLGEGTLYPVINANIITAISYYNNYTTLTHHERLNYSPNYGTTADSNINGWVRLCSQYSARTVEHEFAHTMGVGTASNWAGMFNGSSIWTGQVAQQTLRAIYKDQTLNVKRSGIHFWPCGLNYDSEVTSGETNNLGVTFKGATVLKANAMIVNGMRIDGMTSY